MIALFVSVFLGYGAAGYVEHGNQHSPKNHSQYCEERLLPGETALEQPAKYGINHCRARDIHGEKLHQSFLVA